MEIGTFLLAFLSHWQGYATGGIVTGLIGLVERVRERNLSKRTYVLIFVGVFSIASFFMAWRDQFERAENLQAQVRQKPQQPTIQVNVPPAQVIIQGRAEEKKDIPTAHQVKRPKVAVDRSPNFPQKPLEASPASPNPAATTSQSQAETAPPKPEIAHVRIASQKTVVSTEDQFPYALEVVLQTDTIIEPVAFGLLCTGEVGHGTAGLAGGGVFIKTKQG